MVKELIRYPEEFKIRLVRQLAKGEISIGEARRKYGIGGKMTISKWQKKYGNCGIGTTIIDESMSKKIVINPVEKRLQEVESELALYKKLVEVSDYFRDPAVKKKIVARLSAYLGKGPDELMESDIALLKSVLYSASVGKDTTSTKDEPSDGVGKNRESLSGSKGSKH